MLEGKDKRARDEGRKEGRRVRGEERNGLGGREGGGRGTRTHPNQLSGRRQRWMPSALYWHQYWRKTEGLETRRGRGESGYKREHCRKEKGRRNWGMNIFRGKDGWARNERMGKIRKGGVRERKKGEGAQSGERERRKDKGEEEKVPRYKAI
jgi:hypothetical protein